MVDGASQVVDEQCALFVLPYRHSGYRRPMAPWITTAGLAAAAERRWGSAVILGPDGPATPTRALELATGDAEQPSAASGSTMSSWERVARSAVSDARKLRRNRRFSETLAGTVPRYLDRAGQPRRRVPLVWQRHDLGVSARVLADEVGAPLVVSVHALIGRERTAWGDPSARWAGLLERVGERGALQAADVVSCVSDELAERVVAVGIDAARVVVTPNGVDTDRFHPEIDGRALRTELGLDDRVVIGWTGSFRPFHGLDDLLRAYQQVERSGAPTALLLVGSGQERGPLEALASQLGLTSVVWAGPRSFADMPAVLAAMDIGVVAGGSGSFHYSPVKLREYLASGLAVVAPDAGEMGRTMTSGRDLVLVHPGDVSGLAAAMADLVSNRTERQALGVAGRRWAVEHASWDGELDRLVVQAGRLGRP
ncbi:MAG: glycosyltransferase family 4 protein [Acidimicrobiia bacterium]|nr:glycosyltransferase family 4 protein [Acidimicrobiia bacterium]